MSFSTRCAVTLMLAGAFAATLGCGTSAPTRFHQLSVTASDRAADRAAGASAPVLGVGPITLPGYLDRAQVVFRRDANGLELREFNQWAEPLRENFERVFSENLAARLGTDRLALHPWGGTRVECRVAVRVIRFECDAGGTCTLDARWIAELGEKRVERASRHEAQATGDADSVAERVAAMSRALGAFSDEVAEALHRLR